MGAPTIPDRDFSDWRTARLRLRRFQASDLDAFVAYRADPEVARYQGWGPGFNRQRGQDFLRWAESVDPDTAHEWFQFALERLDRPGLIGDCAACPGDGEVEVGFTLARAEQGRGFAREAVGALLEYLRARGHRRAVARTDEQNVAAQRVLQDVGFALESVGGGEHRYTLDLKRPRRGGRGDAKDPIAHRYQGATGHLTNEARSRHVVTACNAEGAA